MKGASFAWIFGLLMVLVVVAVFLVDGVVHYNSEVRVATAAVNIYDTLHVAEFTKRALDGACLPAAKVAEKELAENGGGFPVWKGGAPEKKMFEEKLARELERQMDTVGFSALSNRDISWEKSDVAIISYDDNGFTFRGSKPFVVELRHANPEVTVKSDGMFEYTAKTGYFKLLRLGRAAAVCPPTEGERTIERVEQKITKTGEDIYSVNLYNGQEDLKLTFTLDCKTENEEQ